MLNYLSTIYDGSFLKTNSLKYLPWVGNRYPALPEEKKVLIVLESVYNWERNDKSKIEEARLMLSDSDFVREIIWGHGLFFKRDSYGVKDSKFARGVERSIFNKSEVLNSESEQLWTYISFHEFVQRPMSNLKEKPSNEDFIQGAKVLKSVINILQPRTCIFYGTSYRKIYPMENEFGVCSIYPKNDKINGAWPSILDINKLDNNHCLIICVKHPSQYFSWDLWNKFIIDNLPFPFPWA